MQPYKYLDNIPNHELISKKVLEYITKYHTDLLESDLFDELIPVSSMTHQGIAEITALLSRILTRGD